MPKSGEKRSFRYQSRSTEDVRERANARGGDFDSYLKSNFKMYKVRDGKNLIRIMPPTWKGARHYGWDIWVNYGIGIDNQSYLSLDKMKEEKDPLLEARREAERDGDEKTAKALKPRQRILMWVIDRLDEDEGPQLWPAPFTFDKDLCNVSFDEDTKEVTMLDDPEKGCDVRFYKEGTGLRTKYPPSKIKILKPSLIHEDEKLENEWLDFITENPLPECVQFYDYDHIDKAYNGHVRVDSDDDEDDRRGGRGRRSSRDDDDDDRGRSRSRGRSRDDDDEKDDRGSSRRSRSRGDEDDEKPSRGRRTPRDEDDEEVPSDEDEKPGRSSRRGRDPDDADKDEEAEEKPPRGKRERTPLKDDPEGDDEADEKPSRGRGKEPDDEDDVGSSIQARLKRRRDAASSKRGGDD